ncbi:hypothetical protein ACIQVA_34335 [Streptomyces microflavus]|uniref:hypothetical protein n=1 Tax=Streptomyces microflavus TaxID=1919 RepID=UPI0038295324
MRIPADRLEQLGYVNRVKFITDGHRRVLVLGTEVFGESTVWGIDLEDCEITEDGRLKTPVSERASSARSSRPASPPPAVTAPPAQRVTSPKPGADVPGVQIGGLARDITAAVRSKNVVRVRELCKQAAQEASRCEGPALALLENTAVRARNWLEGHDLKHRSVFTRLEKAVSSGDSGLPHDRVTSEVACPVGQVGRMSLCPSLTPRSSARMSYESRGTAARA